MNVLFLTPSLGAGGAERQASILLPALRSRGIDARIVALDAGGPFLAPLVREGVPVEVLNMRHQADLAPLARSKIVRDFAPDVIVSRGVSGLYIGHALARWRGAAHAFNDHRGAGIVLSRRRELMVRGLAPRLSSVIVVSADQSGLWLERGCPRDRIIMIPNGVPPLRIADTEREAVRSELGIPDSAVVALLVASLRPVKRVPDFVRAVLKARATCPNLVGVIVGDGPERSQVQAAAGADPAIRLLGHRDDVPRLLLAADMLVLTSQYEATPMAILESMAAGLPVLATRVGGIPQLVVPGETGLLVPPGDTDALAEGIRRLADDGPLRRTMGQAGRARGSEGWGAEAMVDRYAQALEDLAERKRQVTNRRAAGRPPLARLARSFLRLAHSKGWVTWEQSSAGASLLTVTNAWPRPDLPMHGIFLHRTVEGLNAAGIRTDVLFVRGYRGTHCYLLGCAAMALLPVAARGKYRLVHSHGGETAVVARFFVGAPVLASYWGSDILGVPLGSWRSRQKAAVQSRILRVHALLMPATTTKSAEMEAVLPRRARRRNWVIPDGVDRDHFKPIDRQRARRVLGWDAEEVIVLSVGRRIPLKRLWLAEQAAALAAAEIDALRWRVASDVPPSEMPLYYNAANLLLHTSASEGSPNAVKEALACNLPVIATPAGDIVELLRDVAPSAVCEPDAQSLAREIVRCLRSGERSNGRELTAHLGLEAVAARTVQCYRAIGGLPG